MTIINLTTPMSDDKERQQRNKDVLDAIERYTDERMAVDYVCEPADGSRSGGQPAQGYGVVTAANYTSPIGGAGVVTHGVVGVATQSDALREALERIEAATRNEVRAGDKGYISRYGINGIARAALEARGFEIKEK